MRAYEKADLFFTPFFACLVWQEGGFAQATEPLPLSPDIRFDKLVIEKKPDG